jgi:hypothetical protein
MQTIMHCLLAVTLVFLGSCGGGSSFMTLSELQNQLGLEALPSQEDYPEADGVILLSSTDVELNIDSNYELFTVENAHLVKRLLKNIEDQANHEIRLYDGEVLTGIRARTITNDGTSIELTPQDFHTITGSGEGGIFYSDVKKVRFTFPAVEKGCIIEYSYTKRNSYPFVQDVWQIQHFVPTIRNQYRLTLPTLLIASHTHGGLGWNWNYKSYNYSIPRPEDEKQMNVAGTRKDQKHSFIWKLNNIPAFDREPGMPSSRNYRAFVKFAPTDWKTWDDISEFYHKRHFAPQCVITDKISALARELSSKGTTDEEKIGHAFRYAQSLRYVAIDLGIGGIRPNQPQTVLDRQYGDCKDKSILLISLLRSMNIKAVPVLVRTKSEGQIDPTFTSWSFNHMIVKAETADKKVFWLDPTAKYCPLGSLPSEIEGIDVLVINEDGKSKIETTPRSRPQQNGREWDIAVAVLSATEASFKAAITFKGQDAMSSRHYFSERTEKEMKEFCKSLVVGDFVGAVIDGYSVENLDAMEKDLVLRFEFKAGNALQRQGDLYMVNLNPFNLFGSMRWLVKDTRKFPVDFDYPYYVKKTLAVQLPEGRFTVRNMPKNASLMHSIFSYNAEYSSSPNSINATELFMLKTHQLPPTDYAKTKEFFEKVKERQNEKLILVRR